LLFLSLLLPLSFSSCFRFPFVFLVAYLVLTAPRWNITAEEYLTVFVNPSWVTTSYSFSLSLECTNCSCTTGFEIPTFDPLKPGTTNFTVIPTPPIRPGICEFKISASDANVANDYLPMPKGTFQITTPTSSCSPDTSRWQNLANAGFDVPSYLLP
jgi:hypothetical protein